SVCNDGFFCNVGETCQSGVCTGGAAKDCSAFTDQCNTGICNETANACQASPISGTSCNADSSVCTQNDQCLSGVCQAGATLNCNDANVCTTDSCNAVSGCQNVAVANGTGCGSDGNSCTLDTCLGGVCHTAVADGTVCGAAPICTGTPPNA